MKYVSAKEAKKYFQISGQTLKLWKDQNKIKYKQFSPHKILYDIKDKEEIIEKNDDRLSDDYKDFIKSIYRRDSFECKICGDKNNLVSHHINGYNWYKEGRLEPLNNITLCSKCHEEFHNIYGRGDNTWEQFKEYLIFLKNEYSNNYIIDNTIKDVEKRMKILQIRTKNKQLYCLNSYKAKLIALYVHI